MVSHWDGRQRGSGERGWGLGARDLGFGPVGGELGELLLGGWGEGGGVGGEAGELLPAEVLDDVGGELAGLGGDVVGQAFGGVEGVLDDFVEGDEVDLVGGPEHDVVPHVLPDAGEVGQDVDSEGLQVGGWADAGYHEQLRGLESAGRDDDLLAGVDGVFDAGGVDGDACRLLVVVEEDLLG